MAKGNYLYIVAASCDAADDERLNKWYNEVHVPC